CCAVAAAAACRSSSSRCRRYCRRSAFSSAVRCVPRAPYARVPTADATISTGKNENTGVRMAELPEVKYSTSIPAIATTMTSGSNRATGFGGSSRGTGGGARTMSARSGGAGAVPGDRRENSIGHTTPRRRMRFPAVAGWLGTSRIAALRPPPFGLACREQVLRGGGHVSDSVRRVSVQIDTLVDMLIGTDRGGTGIDVTLPPGVEVAELIPAIVDLAVGADGVDAGSPTAWKLARVGGTVLDASRTLTENGIREGELLMLTGAASAPVTRAEAPPGLEPAAGRWHGARTALALWCPIAGTAAVVWTGLMRDDIGRTVPAAMLTVGAVAAVLPYRHRRDPLTATAS